MTKTLVIKSFGLKHADGPEIWAGCTLAFDLREMFKDPHVTPTMRQMTGLDQAVIDNVMAQPGAYHFARSIAGLIDDLDNDVQGSETITLGFACVGGRHRSVVFANEVARLLAYWGVTLSTTVVHVHVGRAVIAR
jgi:UPF0042 nucleotide-binding protein